jgi:hypothetical protein
LTLKPDVQSRRHLKTSSQRRETIDMDGAGVLDDILTRSQRVLEEGGSPVVVLDLDHTLFDNGPRTWEILCEFADREGHSDLRGALEELPNVGLPYLLSETLERVGFDDKKLHDDALAFWMKRFFTDDYQRFDRPLRGAVHFVRRVFEAGAQVVYLSGRDAPGMLVGCAASLRHHEFPVGISGTHIILKPDFETPDLDFKTDAVEHIDRLGTVVASFDNEPGNCNLFAKRWPHALTVFVETAHAPDPPALGGDIVDIVDFATG